MAYEAFGRIMAVKKAMDKPDYEILQTIIHHYEEQGFEIAWMMLARKPTSVREKCRN